MLHSNIFFFGIKNAIFFHISYDPLGEYQFVITLFTGLGASYKGAVLDKYLYNSISLLAINK